MNETHYQRLCSTCKDSAPRSPLAVLVARARWSIRRWLLRAADQVVPVQVDWTYDVNNQFGETVCQVQLEQIQAGYPRLSIMIEDDFTVAPTPLASRAA